jgi:hypothetical protein
MGWVVSATPRPLYPQGRPGTHYIGGWVGPRGSSGRMWRISPPSPHWGSIKIIIMIINFSPIIKTFTLMFKDLEYF